MGFLIENPFASQMRLGREDRTRTVILAKSDEK